MTCNVGCEWSITLKQLGDYASQDYTIYNIADPTPVDVRHAAYACYCMEIHTPTLMPHTRMNLLSTFMN